MSRRYHSMINMDFKKGAPMFSERRSNAGARILTIAAVAIVLFAALPAGGWMLYERYMSDEPNAQLAAVSLPNAQLPARAKAKAANSAATSTAQLQVIKLSNRNYTGQENLAAKTRPVENQPAASQPVNKPAPAQATPPTRTIRVVAAKPAPAQPTRIQTSAPTEAKSDGSRHATAAKRSISAAAPQQITAKPVRVSWSNTTADETVKHAESTAANTTAETRADTLSATADNTHRLTERNSNSYGRHVPIRSGLNASRPVTVASLAENPEKNLDPISNNSGSTNHALTTDADDAKLPAVTSAQVASLSRSVPSGEVTAVNQPTTTSQAIAPPVFTTESNVQRAIPDRATDTVAEDLANLELTTINEAAVISAEPSVVWSTLTVAPGDTLSQLFERIGLGMSDWLPISNLGSKAAPLNRMKVGDKLEIGRKGEVFTALKYPVNAEKTLRIWREEGQLKVSTDKHQMDRRTQHATGTIEHSLFLTANAAGLSDNLTMELAKIFGWDIDFALDIRTGDRFSVLYEAIYREGEYVGNGKILAAEFVNQNRKLRAIRYTDKEGYTGYYTPDGHNMRKAFIRTPVDFARISSGFNLNRRHPILNKIRAHKGVDYAAPKGTKIKSVGDGKVIFAGTKGGYGRTVIIQHGSSYTTLYAHMNSYAKGMRTGKRVSQGQTIGYVGSSGLATGPHLHYEFRINGKHRNPLTVALPKSLPLDRKYVADFKAQAEPLLSWLDGLAEESTLASAGR